MRHFNGNKKKNNSKSTAVNLLMLGTIIVTCTIITSAQYSFSVNQTVQQFGIVEARAPVAVSVDNIYIAWWNGTAGLPDVQTDVMFRASTDGGATFSNSTNLSNTTDADSWRVEIAGEGDTVVVNWWETNQTSDIPVAKVSTDGGETFGPLIRLGANGTIGSGDAEEIALVEGEGEG
jgi:hypothetical protein